MVLGVWTITIGLAHAPELSNIVVVRLAFSSAAVLVLALLTFVFVFPASSLPVSRWYWIFAFLGICLTIASLSRLVVAIPTYDPSRLRAFYGPLHRLYPGYVVIRVLATSLLLVTK